MHAYNIGQKATLYMLINVFFRRYSINQLFGDSSLPLNYFYMCLHALCMLSKGPNFLNALVPRQRQQHAWGKKCRTSCNFLTPCLLSFFLFWYLCQGKGVKLRNMLLQLTLVQDSSTYVQYLCPGSSTHMHTKCRK